MSSMLEQAIVDAQALREAALKNAEQALIEKFTPQIKEAVESLLEGNISENKKIVSYEGRNYSLMELNDGKATLKREGEKHPFGLPEGTLVWVRDENPDDGMGGKIWKYGPGRPMLVSKRMIVAGNGIEAIRRGPYECVSFVGQIPVGIKGPAKLGDLILPTEHSVCRAVDPDEISFREYQSAMGTIIGVPGSLLKPDGTEIEPGVEYNYALVAVGVK